ncbi:MAG: class IV adenylate cyclase, partial [Anaerolineales bacterium]
MMEKQEIEVKFHVLDLKRIEEILLENQAVVIQPRVHELNLRFDTPNEDLSKEHRVLRLRRDQNVLLTYKGPSLFREGARVRTEVQTVVADFEATKTILEELGYQVVLRYEKYRAEYEWHDTHISLDEMPYGNFVEVEGDDPQQIHAVSDWIGLRWQTRIPLSYVEIFHKICSKEAISERDLLFEVFKERRINLVDYGISPADG